MAIEKNRGFSDTGEFENSPCIDSRSEGIWERILYNRHEEREAPDTEALGTGS